jgi:hypothetical protein
MTTVRLRQTIAWETMFLPRSPFSMKKGRQVKVHAHGPEAGR